MSEDKKKREKSAEEIEGLRERLIEGRDGREGVEQELAGAKKHLGFLKKIFDAVPTPIFVKDKDGRYLYCNRSFTEYIGSGKERILGRTDYEVNPQRLADPYNEMDTILLENGDTQDYEVYYKNPDGSSRAILFNKACLKNADGSVSGLVGVITDITDRKAIEEEKKELIGRLHSALAEIKKLSGLLPICSYCKKVRDDQGYWSKIEKYVQEHSEAKFSHGICPDCLKQYYPEKYERWKEGK